MSACSKSNDSSVGLTEDSIQNQFLAMLQKTEPTKELGGKKEDLAKPLLGFLASNGKSHEIRRAKTKIIRSPHRRPTRSVNQQSI